MRERARIVEVTVRRGNCDGAPVFRTEVTRRNQGSAPGPLPGGRYGFSARAQDASCQWFASGCSEVTLPGSAAIRIALEQDEVSVLDDRCGEPGTGDPRSDSDGAELFDAAVPAFDGASEPPPDGSLPGLPDATAEQETGADGGARFDPGAPKCSEPPQEVVACLDFNGDLAEDSDQEHWALGPDAAYEPGLSGKAIRVQNTRVTLHDHPALQLGATFTIEMWLRADSLVNLDGEQTATSLLLDKDQQYNLGFEPSGKLVAAVYAAVGDERSLQADASDVRVGAYTYVAFVYAGGVAALYQDGTLRGSAELGVTPYKGTGQALHLGSGSPNVTRPYDGLIDALRIWTRALDGSEVCRNAGRSWLGATCE